MTDIVIDYMKTEEFYLVSELAKKLRVSDMTIYRYIRAGKIEALKFGKEYRISHDEVERFIKRSKYQS